MKRRLDSLRLVLACFWIPNTDGMEPAVDATTPDPPFEVSDEEALGY